MGRVTAGELDDLRIASDAYNKRWVANGHKLTKYICNHCEKDIPTPRPEKDDVTDKGFWDSAMTCTNCGRMNFVLVYPTGKSKSTRM